VIATFGVARPSPTYAADATVALDEALGEIDRWNAHRHAAGLDPVAVNAAPLWSQEEIVSLVEVLGMGLDMFVSAVAGESAPSR